MFYRKHPTFLLTKIGGFYFYSKHFSKFYFHFLLRQTLKNQTNSRFLSAVCLMDIKIKNIDVGTMRLSGARVFRKQSKL